MDQVDLFGLDWLEETYKLIQEAKRNDYLMLLSIIPAARTPMDENGGRWLTKYMKDLRKMIFELTPWDKAESVRSAYRGRIKSGTIAVILDDPRLGKDPMFKDAKVVKG